MTFKNFDLHPSPGRHLEMLNQLDTELTMMRVPYTGRGIESGSSADIIYGRPNLGFRYAAKAIPHPEKEATLGEDAYFATDGALGVFDGVSSWRKHGIDAGEYSREMATLTVHRLLKKHGILTALSYAHKNNRLFGSCTATVVQLRGNDLSGVSIGDSKLVIVRQGRIAYESKNFMHSTNCPFQLGRTSSGTRQHDSVVSGFMLSFTVHPTDVIILGSDGLFDNVFQHEIVEVTQRALQRNKHWHPRPMTQREADAERSRLLGSTHRSSRRSGTKVYERPESMIARILARRAHDNANDTRSITPYSNWFSRLHRKLFKGGKLDDVSVVCAIVVDNEFKLPRLHAGNDG